MARFSPTTAEEVAAIVADAGARNAPLEILGGASKRDLGRPVQAEHTLSLAALTGIRLYEPEELVMTVGAGTTLDEIEAALAEGRQHLAFEPPDWRQLLGTAESTQTVGGLVAANLSGARRIQAGAARDHLLGFQAVNGRGEIFKSGGRVVKNVTGYDLAKLMAGSYGTLAVLSEITLKVMPRPEETATLVCLGAEAAEGVRLMTRALAAPLDISGAAWLPGDLALPLGYGQGEDATLLRLEGLGASVADRMAALETRLGPGLETRRLDAEASRLIWRKLGAVLPLTEPRHHPVWRVSVPPSRGHEVLAALPGARGYLDWGGGQVWLALPPSADTGAATVRAAASRFGGHATLVRAEAALRAAVPVFAPQEPALAALGRRVKAGFDPLGILNPGRLYA